MKSVIVDLANLADCGIGPNGSAVDQTPALFDCSENGIMRGYLGVEGSSELV